MHQAIYGLPNSHHEFVIQFNEDESGDYYQVWIKYQDEDVSYAKDRFFDMGIKLLARDLDEAKSKVAVIAQALWEATNREKTPPSTSEITIHQNT